MMKTKWFLTLALLIGTILVVAGSMGPGLAQGPEPGGEVGPEGGVGPAAIVADAIPIQGRLTDASGNPLDGTYNLTLRLYNVSSGGTALCEDTDSVTVDNGLFSAAMRDCTSSDMEAGNSTWASRWGATER